MSDIEYTELDVFHDEIRVAMLNHLYNIACANASMWEHEHPGATNEQVAEARLKYFRLVFEPFWDIAKDIKLQVWVGYSTNDPCHKSQGSMLQPDVEDDMGCYLCAYNEVIDLEN